MLSTRKDEGKVGEQGKVIDVEVLVVQGVVGGLRPLRS
jgi:hypothetical protein